MGLSSFNRMRREKAKVAEIEAERFKRDNEARQARRQARVDAQGADDELAAKAMQEEHEATKRIGMKVEEGRESTVIDEPLRRDHAAEIAGRNLEGVQEPTDPVAHVAERIPAEKTANEKLVPLTGAESDGPTAEQVQAAAKEVGALPAPAGEGEGVAPKGESSGADIPADWEDLHWKTRVSLAEKLSGREDLKTEEANDIIAAEVKRRAE